MLCVIAIIDSAATERLGKLRQVAERFGIPPRDVHGHVTLATYIGDDEESFTASCKAMLSGREAFPIYYDNVEIWLSESGAKSLIVAAPRKEPTIVSIQKEIAQAWSADLNEWTQEDIWTPHTSLLYVQGADLSAIAETMQKKFEPFIARVDRIEFSRVHEDEGKFSYEIIDSVKLQ